MQDGFVVEQERKVDSGGSPVRIGKRVCDAGPLSGVNSEERCPIFGTIRCPILGKEIPPGWLPRSSLAFPLLH